MVMNSSRAILSLGTWIGTTQRPSRFLSAAGFVADSFASKFSLVWFSVAYAAFCISFSTLRPMAHTKPESSRAIAVTIFPTGIPL